MTMITLPGVRKGGGGAFHNPPPPRSMTQDPEPPKQTGGYALADLARVSPATHEEAERVLATHGPTDAQDRPCMRYWTAWVVYQIAVNQIACAGQPNQELR